MDKKIVALALQGGGSHGAFTWGVLDRLLEDGRIGIDAISGASAGAMNAVVLAHGFTVGGPDGARQALKDFWERIGATAQFSAAPNDLSQTAPAASQGDPSPSLGYLLSLTHMFSPSQLNPLGLNPLRDILSRQIDFERLRADCKLELFIATTRVSTGTLSLFRTRQLSLEVLLASACIPGLHQTVNIEGEAYWDGGLTANPPILPLAHEGRASDVIMVLLQPLRRAQVPTTAGEIRGRLSEISFSSAFFTELQGLALAKREAEQALLPFGRLQRRLRELKLHAIDAEALMLRLSTLSKFNAHPAFIRALRDEGRLRAESWLEQNFDLLGERSSFQLDKFLGSLNGGRTRASDDLAWTGT
jgi:NTE family protein